MAQGVAQPSYRVNGGCRNENRNRQTAGNLAIFVESFSVSGDDISVPEGGLNRFALAFIVLDNLRFGGALTAAATSSRWLTWRAYQILRNRVERKLCQLIPYNHRLRSLRYFYNTRLSSSVPLMATSLHSLS